MLLLLALVSCLVGFCQSRLTREMVLTKEVIETTQKPPFNTSEPSKKPETIHIYVNDTERDSRGLLKKIGLIAGLKAGGLISSSGTLAASNSLRIFGKVMNTALSVSYGHADDLDPLPVVQADHQSESDQKEVRITTTNSPLYGIRKNFIKHHNTQVSRINNKYLRSGETARDS